ncbi:hypothetical protein [Azospirillum endophyticum]
MRVPACRCRGNLAYGLCHRRPAGGPAGGVTMAFPILLSSDRPPNASGDHGFCRMRRASASGPLPTDVSRFHHLVLSRPPRLLPHRDGRIRLRAVPSADADLSIGVRAGSGTESEGDRPPDRVS